MAQMTQEAPPPCFGKEWSPREVECTGGLDPTFTSSTGNHVREKCPDYSSCGTRTQAKKMEESRGGLIPAQSLLRPQPPQPQPQQTVQPPRYTPQPASQFASSLALAQAQQQQQLLIAQHQAALAQQQQPRFAQPYQPPYQHPPYQHQPPQVNHHQMMPVNYQMPGYLTAPEPMSPGRSFWHMLGATVIRSMAKSAGHSVAHVFDTVPFGFNPGGDGK